MDVPSARYDTNAASSRPRLSDDQVSSTPPATSTVNKPYPFVHSDVWDWLIGQGLLTAAEALGQATEAVTDDFGIDRDEVSIHLSYDGDEVYAIVARIPVGSAGGERYERMAEIEDRFYASLEEKLDPSTFEWLQDETSLAFLPGR